MAQECRNIRSSKPIQPIERTLTCLRNRDDEKIICLDREDDTVRESVQQATSHVKVTDLILQWRITVGGSKDRVIAAIEFR